MRFGVLELSLIIVIALLFFGPKQLPKLTAAITDSFKSFKNSMEDEDNDDNTETIKAKTEE